MRSPNANTGVIKNRYGYFELSEKPTQTELHGLYTKRYYQEAMGAYQHDYSKDERKYFSQKIEQIYHLVEEARCSHTATQRFLDIGCGEGWALDFFKKRGWRVIGLDYCDHGCGRFNRDSLADLRTGDIGKNIEELIRQQETFEVIWLTNVLEHVLVPLELLKQCSTLLSRSGVIIIKVPNDFSALQKMLLEEGYVDKQYWIAVPDHISYFNREGLISLCRSAGLESGRIVADFPIDFNLFNENTNYIKARDKGRSCHLSRLKVENLFHSISIEKTNQLYQVMAEMGIGREIIGLFRKGTMESS